MTKGEFATFFCLILSGEAIVKVNEKLNVTLKPGEVIGDMSYFENGGTRGCDVVASKSCTLAVILFDDIDQLQGVDGRLQHVLTRMLAKACIIKFQKQLKKSPVKYITKKESVKLVGTTDKKETLFDKRARERKRGVRASSLERVSTMSETSTRKIDQ